MTTNTNAIAQTLGAISGVELVTPKEVKPRKPKVVRVSADTPINGDVSTKETKLATHLQNHMHSLSGDTTIRKLAAIAGDAGHNAADMNRLQTQAVELLAKINKSIIALYQSKTPIGDRADKCPITGAFACAMLDRGLAKGTIQNYTTEFRKACRTGKPLTGWNGSRVQGKAKEGEKKERATPELSALILRAFNSEEGIPFKKACLHIEKIMQRDDVPLHHAMIQWLESEGVEFKDGKGK
jgi:hypothetical protein